MLADFVWIVAAIVAGWIGGYGWRAGSEDARLERGPVAELELPGPLPLQLARVRVIRRRRWRWPWGRR